MGGKVVILVGDDERARALARALAAEGAGVLLATADAVAGGRLASELAGTGARVAVFSPGPDPTADVDALVEMAGELTPRG